MCVHGENDGDEEYGKTQTRCELLTVCYYTKQPYLCVRTDQGGRRMMQEKLRLLIEAVFLVEEKICLSISLDNSEHCLVCSRLKSGKIIRQFKLRILVKSDNERFSQQSLARRVSTNLSEKVLTLPFSFVPSFLAAVQHREQLTTQVNLRNCCAK